jgi:chromosome partitioning protein
MRVITFVTQKGGAGKTTLTVNCAVAAERKKKVLILDLDAQASAEGWYQDRESDTPRLVRIKARCHHLPIRRLPQPAYH